MIYAEIALWILMCSAYVAYVFRQVHLKRIKSLSHMSISDHVAVLLNLVLLGVAVFALQISVAAYTDAQKSGDEQLKALAAARQAIIDTGDEQVHALEGARSTLSAVADQFRLEQRAWVGPTNIVLGEMHAPDPIKASVTILNSGKTPAFEMRVRYILHASDTPLAVQAYAKNPVEKLKGRGAVSTLFPNAQMQLAPTTGTTDALGIQSVENGRKFLYLFAWVWYIDAFDTPHETRICAQWQPKSKFFAPCNEDYDYAN
jgi:hypothetical protein